MLENSALSTRNGADIIRNTGPNMWSAIIFASIILMITMGVRQTVGLFLHPIVDATTMNVAEVSMAMAIGQLMWGVFQPLFGALADKKSAFFVLTLGVLLICAGQLLTIWATSPLLLIISQGILSPAGCAAGSFSVLIGIVAARLPSDKSSVASGVINAGGSVGQFALAPLVQLMIHLRGYYGGLVLLAGSALLSIIPSWFLCKGKNGVCDPSTKQTAASAGEPTMTLRQQLKIAAKDRSYILLHIGFFTCGFHVAFLTTHLPGEVSLSGFPATVAATSLSLIGLCNIGGSVIAGILGKYFRMKYILSALYAFRAAMIAMYLMSAKTETDFYIFAVATGFTWLATVPPTSGIVGKLFGTRYLATLFGLTLLSHQIGGFLGAWLGGLAIQLSGNLQWVWYLDVILALIAALVNLPIREPKPVRSVEGR